MSSFQSENFSIKFKNSYNILQNFEETLALFMPIIAQNLAFKDKNYCYIFSLFDDKSCILVRTTDFKESVEIFSADDPGNFCDLAEELFKANAANFLQFISKGLKMSDQEILENVQDDNLHGFDVNKFRKFNSGNF